MVHQIDVEMVRNKNFGYQTLQSLKILKNKKKIQLSVKIKNFDTRNNLNYQTYFMSKPERSLLYFAPGIRFKRNSKF